MGKGKKGGSERTRREGWRGRKTKEREGRQKGEHGKEDEEKI